MEDLVLANCRVKAFISQLCKLMVFISHIIDPYKVLLRHQSESVLGVGYSFSKSSGMRKSNMLSS